MYVLAFVGKKSCRNQRYAAYFGAKKNTFDYKDGNRNIKIA
jgi:hypothetical protein